MANDKQQLNNLVFIGQDNIVKLLLKYEVDVNHSLHTGWTPLYIAAENGNTQNQGHFVNAYNNYDY